MDNVFDFSIDQGSTFRMVFQLQDANEEIFDLSNFTAEMMCRKAYGSSIPQIQATVLNGKLSINTATGQITLVLDPEDTMSIRFAEPDDETLDLVYDLEIIHSLTNEVYKPVRGIMTLVREVTRY